MSVKNETPSSNGDGALPSERVSSLNVNPFHTNLIIYHNLSRLAEEQELLLTPFERNIEVWRQLWRVLERSHLIVQIVDARNPLRFRCEDLELYVSDIEGPEGESGSALTGFRRNNLLLINKADLLTNEQRSASANYAAVECVTDAQLVRRQWADYFDQQGVTYAFFSAANATALQKARREIQEAADAALDNPIDDEGDESDEEERETDGQEPRLESPLSDPDSDTDYDETLYYSAEEDPSEDARITVLTVPELEELFIRTAPQHLPRSSAYFMCYILLIVPTAGGSNHPTRLTVGLVGYPNVGKSSTINSLLGEKKVSVSATPGKTKHFQTIHLSPDLVLCDCPGLVFPQFAVQKAELVCDGVLPVDQLRESHGPVALVTKRIGRDVLEATYGLAIRRRGEETGFETDDVSAEDLLIAYAST